jgi:heme exporter protein CcmD
MLMSFHMDHLPYVAGAYALSVLVPVLLAIDAVLRSRRAARRLATLDKRTLDKRTVAR